jgi:RimJ/RimL family protein N-acetyltransferase
MSTPRTRIRLVETDDAQALAAHLGRDAEAFARWDPERPPEFYTAAGQRSRIEATLIRYHDDEVWPGVVLAGDVVIGQVTVQNIMRRAWRKAEFCAVRGLPFAHVHRRGVAGRDHVGTAAGLVASAPAAAFAIGGREGLARLVGFLHGHQLG